MGQWISSSAELALVRRAADAADAVDRVGPTGWGRAKCPLCISRVGTDDHRGGLGVDFSSGYFHCFRCKARGRLALAGTQDETAPPLPGDRLGRPDIVVEDPELGPPGDFEPLWKEPGRSALSLEPARKYLRSRGVYSQTIEEAQIGACLTDPPGAEMKLAGRVVVPLLDIAGTWLGWQARSWAAGYRIKYLSATGMDREANVYNPAALTVETEDPLLVVEGIFDALPYWPDVVALLGKPSEGQINLLLSALRPLVVVLDGDAWIEGEMLAARLAFDGARATWIKLPPTRDPGDLEPSWVLEEARRAADATT